MVSKITDKLIPSIEKWKTRTLEDIYYFVFLDAIHFSVREDKSTVKKAANVVLGVDQEGKKIYWESILELMKVQSFG